LSGETDLATLLRTMQPELHAEPYAYIPLDSSEPPPAGWLALIREAGGIAAIAPHEAGEWARISLTVHSSLEAVGLTAAVSTALAEAAISANMIAGSKHDHILVPWDRRADAMAILTTLGES